MNLDHLEGKELFKALKANRETIAKDKLTNTKYADAVVAPITIAPREHKESSVKADGSPEEPSSEPGTVKVTVVCNTAWFCDSHMDVLADTAYDASIAKRGNTIPHIADHTWESTAHVGDVQKVYTKKLSFRELGLNSEGSTTALLMDSIVREDYNKHVYKFYSKGKINQHSIGLTYTALKLALNSDDEEDVAEYTVWKEYYDKIINKELVDKRGYFWLVPSVDVLENSCVLFGANALTPTLSSKTHSSLGNLEETLTQPQTIGKTMTIEELQGKIISLTQELAEVKGALATAKVEATSAEKARILGILKAQETFGGEASLRKAATTFIEKGNDVDTAIASFEVIKEAVQGASHVDTASAGLPSGTDKPKDEVKGFEAELLAGLKANSDAPQLFKGVR